MLNGCSQFRYFVDLLVQSCAWYYSYVLRTNLVCRIVNERLEDLNPSKTRLDFLCPRFLQDYNFFVGYMYSYLHVQAFHIIDRTVSNFGSNGIALIMLSTEITPSTLTPINISQILWAFFKICHYVLAQKLQYPMLSNFTLNVCFVCVCVWMKLSAW